MAGAKEVPPASRTCGFTALYAAATPSTGQDTLVDFFAKRLRGDATDDRGEHAVFS